MLQDKQKDHLARFERLPNYLRLKGCAADVMVKLTKLQGSRFPGRVQQSVSIEAGVSFNAGARCDEGVEACA